MRADGDELDTAECDFERHGPESPKWTSEKNACLMLRSIKANRRLAAGVWMSS